MDRLQWAQHKLRQLEESSTDYRQKALYTEAIEFIQEMDTRREQNQGELDGVLWSPDNWNG